MSPPLLLDHAEDPVLAHDEELVVTELDVGARVLADEHAVALFHLGGDALAVVVELAGADADDLGLLRLLLGGVRDDDPALDDFLLLEPPEKNPVVEWTYVHR